MTQVDIYPPSMAIFDGFRVVFPVVCPLSTEASLFNDNLLCAFKIFTN